MQVANDNELTTSATLGGKKAISFGISDDPAFFHVLSSSLYNNPNLAVVRETICNQWDAHIEAGKTHLPVLITIDMDNFITFRDYGHGIPDSKIGQVYGMYGASTKKANSSVTGGFGLGCKSPFAYTDSFQVTSWNQGKMSIYNVTKSSVETDGKPGIIPILSGVPTEETGLEVKFQLNGSDITEFVSYIKSIVFNGEIKAILRKPTMSLPDKNGTRNMELTDEELPVLGMSFEPGSYNLSRDWWQSYMGNNAVYVRYGNVMYPAVQSPATEEALSLIHNFMNIIGTTRIVVQAAPSTLAIAPSRETLSNQKMTDDGIVDICVNLVDKLEAEIKAGIPEALNQIKEGILNSKSEDYNWSSYPNFIDYVTNCMVRGYMSSSLWNKQRVHYYPYWKNLSNEQFFKRAEFNNVVFNKAKAMAALKETRRAEHKKHFCAFLQRYVVLPQLWKWKKAGIVWSGNIIANGSYGCYLYKNRLASYLIHNTSLNILQLLVTKNVVVTRRMSDCEESFHYYPDYSGMSWNKKCDKVHGYSARKCAHVIHVGAKKEYAEEAVKKYKALGFNVIDLTQENSWDLPGDERRRASARAAATRNAKKAELLAKGMLGSEPNRLISIACLANKYETIKDGKIIDVDYIHSCFANPENWKRYNHVDVEEPKYYIMQNEINRGSLESNPKITSMYYWNDLTDDIKAVTIVCRNKIELNKAIKRGAVHLDEKRYKELMDVINSKEFKKYATEQRIGILEYFGMDDGTYQELFKLLGIKSKIFDSLVLKPEFEWAYKFLDNASYKDRVRLIELGVIANASELVEHEKITHLNSFKRIQEIYDIKGIFSSGEVGGLLYGNTPNNLLNWLKKHPEDIPGYKALIRNCLTKRKGIYTR